MPTSYTSLIGLALPATGELSGTWGATVNDYITQYLDAAIAGAQTISGSQTAVTLSQTTGAALVTAGSGGTGSSQYSIINCTGNPASALTITVPTASKVYLVLNATSTSQSVTVKPSGNPGITVAAGRAALIAWNGSDFVRVATNDLTALSGTISLTTQVTGTLPVANGGTGSTATAYCALGSNVSGTLPIANGGTGSTSTTYCALGSNVSGTLPVANGGTGVTSSTGTGSTVLSTSPTLTTPALGAATATTPAAGTNGTGVATTAFVQNRAWVRFDGTQIAANMIKAAWNVSSITDNGTGDYTLNFGTAMADANFCAVVSINNVSGGGSLVQPYVVTPSSASNVQIQTLQNSGGSPADTAGTHVAVFR